MKNFISVLKASKLFEGVDEEEISSMLVCLNACVKNYKKGEYVLRQGDVTHSITVVVSGRLHVQKDDYWGNRSIVNVIETGEMFGEAFSFPNGIPVLNDVVAIEDSSVIFFDAERVLTVCSGACRFHSLVVKNLFSVISERNRILVQKLDHMSKRTTREKLISYLSEESKRKKSSSFEIPFNRQQLADFLSVDRSAMSNELCKMRDEGLIEFQKNKFVLL